MADETNYTDSIDEGQSVQAPPALTGADVSSPASTPPFVPDSGPVVGMSGSPTMAAAGNIPQPPPAAPAQQPRLWQRILTGALDGLAGAQGAKSFAGGITSGVAGGLEAAKQRTFLSVQAADRAAQAARLDHQMHQEDEQMQMRRDDHAMQVVKFNKDTFGTEYDAVPNTASNAQQYLAQSVANSPKGPDGQPMGADVPAGIIVSPSTLYIPKQGPNTAQQQTAAYNKIAPVLGLPTMPQGQTITPEAYQTANNQFMGHDRTGGLLDPKALPSVISTMKANIDQYSKSPTKDDAVLAQANKTLSVLQAQLDANDTHEATQAGAKTKAESDARVASENSPAAITGAANKAAAEAKAKLPFEQAKARFDQTLKDGDPASAGQMLVDGLVAPSQIISSRNPRFAQQAFAAAKAKDPNWNAQKAEADFKIASSSNNTTFFGSANSLLDPGGNLDQLRTLYKDLPNGRIPAFNKLSDWTAAATGSGATAAFAAKALGVADDYAKVMGGGVGSDKAREDILHTISMSSSPEAMDSAIAATRSSVQSQAEARIGRNKVLRAMYGQNPAAPFDPKKDFKPIGQ